MKVVDANVLIYAVNSSDPKHEESRVWLDRSLSGGDTVGFSWVTLLAFLRLVTRVGLFPRPLPVADALATLRAWVGAPTGVVLEPTPRHMDILASLLGETGSAGNLTSDAHLAALALEYDGTVVTFDSDFGRFSGVRWASPRDLAGAQENGNENRPDS